MVANGEAISRRIVDWLRPSRLRVYPLALAIAVWGAWIASAATGALSADRAAGDVGLLDSTGRVIGTDFLAFYTAGRFVVDGREAELYDFDAQTAFQNDLGARARRAILFPFVNPPFAALIYAPIAVASYPVALGLWLAVGLVMVGATIALLRSELGSGGAGFGRWLAAALIFFPTIVWAMHGQNTPLSLLIYTAAFVLLRRGQDFGAGAVLGLLLYKPQLALGLGAVLIVQGRWKAVAGGIMTVAAWLTLSWLALPGASRAYLELAPRLPSLLRESPKTWGIHSFFGWAMLLFDGWSRSLADTIAALLTVGTLVALAWMWRRVGWRPGSEGWDLAMAATFAAGLLLSPHLFTYSLMLLLLPLFIVWRRVERELAGGRGDRPLDGGPLLAATAVLYVAVVGASYLSQGQLIATGLVGLPPTALQLSTPVLAGWAALIGARALALARVG